MSTTIQNNCTYDSMHDPRFKAKLQELRGTDNYTNIWYLVRTYVFLIAVIGGTIGFYYFQSDSGLPFWWNIPVTILAVVLIGAGQHQLTGLAHEGSHHILFKNRLWNDLASDWLCMFPLYSSIQHYRLQHLAHHQFVNDPERDPDVSQLQSSGHWLNFPVSKKEFITTLLRQFWIPNLIRFMRIRAAYNAVPSDKNPYLKKGWKPKRTAVLVGMAYMVALICLLTILVRFEQTILLAVLPLVGWVGIMIFYAVIPAHYFHQSRVHPVVSMRAMSMMRLTYITALFTGLAWASLLLDSWAVMYYFLLWIVPIFTSFSFFMILRQLVQHGNGDRGWLTNTRVFSVNQFINFAVFPMGQDYHLPHHLFSSIPHYRLRQLHQELMKCPEYRDQAIEVEGYFLPRERPPKHPTVLDVLGPEYHYHATEVYIDNSVLDEDEVEEKEAILQQGEEAKRRRRAELAKAHEIAS